MELEMIFELWTFIAVKVEMWTVFRKKDFAEDKKKQQKKIDS